MRKVPRISESEWEVMKVLWESSPLTANDIVEVLSKRASWQRETIRTLINRLVQKKAVRFEKKGANIITIRRWWKPNASRPRPAPFSGGFGPARSSRCWRRWSRRSGCPPSRLPVSKRYSMGKTRVESVASRSDMFRVERGACGIA